MESRLTRVAGVSPRGSVRLGVQDGLIVEVSFPWLSMSFPADLPVENALFVEWLRSEHPSVVPTFWEGRAPGAIYEWVGEELVFVLTPHNMDLLEVFLEEYEDAAGVD